MTHGDGSQASSREVLLAEDLRKFYGPRPALQGLSFSLRAGRILGFLGPNGAGKSTTMKMITGFLRPTSGTASICGFDVLDHPIDAKKRLGYLPEGAPLYPDMTPVGFLRFIAEARGLSGAAKHRAVEEAIARTELSSVLRQPIETLSKGFKRRVGLAQALLHDPEVLILDEPTDGLDPNQKHEVRALIRAMAPEKAIVISTHILEEVDAVCTRAVIIARGKLVAEELLCLPGPDRGEVPEASGSCFGVPVPVDRSLPDPGAAPIEVRPIIHVPQLTGPADDGAPAIDRSPAVVDDRIGDHVVGGRIPAEGRSAAARRDRRHEVDLAVAEAQQELQPVRRGAMDLDREAQLGTVRRAGCGGAEAVEAEHHRRAGRPQQDGSQRGR